MPTARPRAAAELLVAPPRVEPGGRREVARLGWLLARGGGRRYGIEPVRLFLTLGRARRVFYGWLVFAAALMPGGRLPRRDSELVILRVAHLMGSDYERRHHERIAPRTGLTTAQIDATAQDPPGRDVFSDRQRDLLAATEAFVTTDGLDDEHWSALASHLAPAELVEFLLLAGHYRMLATVIDTLGIVPERPTSAL